jgi:murein DD-endopeptidase MepM/ murein hydrolase activator NlpD
LIIFCSIDCKNSEIKENTTVEVKKDSIVFDFDMLGDSAKYIRQLDTLFSRNPDYISDGFDYPVADGTLEKYKVGNFYKNNYHLGEDCGGKIGTPILAVSNGIVVLTNKERITWGNVVRIVHQLENDTLRYVETLYAHLDTFSVKKGDFVKRGEQIGTMGDSDGYYVPHLHFEFRQDITVSLSHGYADAESEWMYRWFLNPREFIKDHRPKI